MTRFRLVSISASLCAALFLCACPGNSADAQRCNDTRDCGSAEVCADGECVLDPSGREPEQTPEPLEPSVVAPEGEPAVGPEGEPAASPEGEPAVAPEGEPDTPPEPSAGEPETPEPDSGPQLDGGVPSTPEVDGGAPSEPTDFDGEAARVSLVSDAINAGDSLEVLVDEMAPGAVCDIAVGDESVSVSTSTVLEFSPAVDGDVEIACSSTAGDEVGSLSFIVFTIEVGVEQTNDGAVVASLVTSHSSTCRAVLNGVPVWEGAGTATETLPGSFGTLQVFCDGVADTEISAEVAFALGPVDVGTPELFVLQTGNLSLEWPLADGAFCSLTHEGAVVFTEELVGGGTLDTELGPPGPETEGEWTLLCRNTGGETASATFVVEPAADASDIRFKISDGVGFGGGFGSKGLPVTIEWNFVGSCTANGEPIPNQGATPINEVAAAGQFVLVFECSTSTGTDRNEKRIAAGAAAQASFDPHVILGDFAVSTTDAVFPALEIVGGALALTFLAEGTVSAPALKEIGTGLMSQNSNVTALDFPQLRRIVGSLLLNDDPFLGELSLPALETVGSLALRDLAGPSNVSLPRLEEIANDMTIDDSFDLVMVDLGALERIGGNLRVDNNADLAELKLNALAEVGRIAITDNSELTLVEANELPEAEAVVLTGNSEIITAKFPALQRVSNNLVIRENASLTMLIGGALERAGAALIVENSSLPNAAAEAFFNDADGTIPTLCPNADPC